MLLQPHGAKFYPKEKCMNCNNLGESSPKKRPDFAELHVFPNLLIQLNNMKISVISVTFCNSACAQPCWMERKAWLLKSYLADHYRPNFSRWNSVFVELDFFFLRSWEICLTGKSTHCNANLFEPYGDPIHGGVPWHGYRSQPHSLACPSHFVSAPYLSTKFGLKKWIFQFPWN